MSKQILLLFFLFGYIVNVNAQNWTQAEFNKADTGEYANYLTDEEKDVIFFMNLSRLDGEKFFKTYLQDYVNKYNAYVKQFSNYNELKIISSNNYYTSLWVSLKETKNLPMLFPDEKLSNVSRSHALDLKRNNLDTHESSNGDSFSKRLWKHFPNKAISENIDFGNNIGLSIVCHLLLDYGVPSLGHRYTILDKKYNLNTVGVSIQPHPTYKYCAVIDFIAQPSF